jgi:tRNA1(Val) A37 N6-methylase TrmN6
VSDTTQDRFLGGRVTVCQPVSGFRSGLDAVMLAACVPARAGEQVLELGAGAGAASLCLATRVAGCAVEGVEIEPVLAALAQANAAANGLEERVAFHAGDALALPAALRRDFAHVFANPPFHGEAGAHSPDPGRERALRDAGRFGDWLRTGLRRTVSGGTFSTIFRADRLGEALAVLPATGLVVFPLWPRAGAAARRVILQLRKGSGSPAMLLPGLVLHASDGGPAPEAEAVLRDGARLALDNPQL